MVTAYYY